MEVDVDELADDEWAYLSEDYLALMEEESTQPQWWMCTVGVAQSLQPLLFKLFLCALFKRILVIVVAYGRLSVRLMHICMTLCGTYVLWTQNDTFSHILLFVALLTPFVYATPYLHRTLGLSAISLGIGTLLLWQFTLPAERFMSIRGSLMVLVMKFVSLFCDVGAEGEWHRFDLIGVLSYLLDPCTVLFGPWIPFNHYQQSFNRSSIRDEVKSILYAGVVMGMSLVFVVYSSCIVDSVFPHTGFWHSFAIAQSFRFSHYFVSWLSASTAIASGIPSGLVTDWVSIEWPRSLVDVVVSWSIPMHRFLQKYIFAEMRVYGAAIAIFATYAVSSLLHGVNFQLSAVLLSLGLYTYVETRIRTKLSARLNSCIAARRCRDNCGHLHNKNACSTMILNGVFRIIAMVHLVYLGMVFDDSAAESGYSYEHTIRVWSDWYFASHICAAFMLFLSFLL